MKIEVKLYLYINDNNFYIDDLDFNDEISVADDIKKLVKIGGIKDNIDNNDKIIDILMNECFYLLKNRYIDYIHKDLCDEFLDFLLHTIATNIDFHIIYINKSNNIITYELDIIQSENNEKYINSIINESYKYFEEYIEIFNEKREYNYTIFSESASDYIFDDYIYEYVKLLYNNNYTDQILSVIVDNIEFRVIK